MKKHTHLGLLKAAVQSLDSIWIHTVGLARWSLKAGSKGQLPLVLCPKAWDSLILLAASPGRCPGLLRGEKAAGPRPPHRPGLPRPDTCYCCSFAALGL